LAEAFGLGIKATYSWLGSALKDGIQSSDNSDDIKRLDSERGFVVMIEERRKHRRYEASELLKQPGRLRIAFIEVRDINTRESIGHLLDLSRSGLKIICNREIPRRAHCSFYFDLPVGKGRSETVYVNARCIWSRSAGEGSSHVAGLEFTSVLEASRQLIEAVLGTEEAVTFQQQ